MVAYGAIGAIAIGHGGAVVGLPSAVLLGFLLSTALPVMHEAAHGHVTRGGTGDAAIGTLAGLALLVSFPRYREIHLDHHAHLGEDGDAEIPTEVTSRAVYLSLLGPRYFLAPYWRETWHALRGRRDRAAASVARFLVAPMLGLLLAATWAWPGALVWGYWLPLWVCGAWMFLTTLPEHYGSDAAHTVTRGIRCGPVLAWLLWNTHLHEAHHEVPALPCDALAHADVAPAPAETFAAFHRRVWRELAAR